MITNKKNEPVLQVCIVFRVKTVQLLILVNRVVQFTKRGIRNGNMNNALFVHMLENNHIIDWDGFDMI